MSMGGEVQLNHRACTCLHSTLGRPLSLALSLGVLHCELAAEA